MKAWEIPAGPRRSRDGGGQVNDCPDSGSSYPLLLIPTCQDPSPTQGPIRHLPLCSHGYLTRCKPKPGISKPWIEAYRVIVILDSAIGLTKGSVKLTSVVIGIGVLGVPTDSLIVTWAEWELVQQQLGRNQANETRNGKRTYALRGILFCSEDGRRLSEHSRKGRNGYVYDCPGRREG